MKNNLFNNILEVRRYEKNYLLNFNKKDIDQALAYIRSAENISFNLTSNYGKNMLANNLPDLVTELKAYKKSLLNLLKIQENGTQLPPQDMVILIQGQGHRITTELEDIVAQEGQLARNLVSKSKTIHLVALVPIIILSILVTIFLLFNVNRPLKTIERAIQKISKGDYKNIPEISSGDEFESLATSINNMINELDKRSDELDQAKKLASLGRLVSGVAHELNNPLNNISTSHQILIEELEGNIQEYHKELLISAEKEVDRGQTIVKGLLEFSRKKSFTKEWINLQELINDAIKLVNVELPDNIILSVKVPGDIEANVGPQQIKRVLINLILNAAQAMEDGGDITISAESQVEKGGLSFQVQDTGSGIPIENITKIFDPFFTTKDVGKGSGLGLSIVYGIIEQHGGKVSVSSQEGKGTTFTVFLPIS